MCGRKKAHKNMSAFEMKNEYHQIRSVFFFWFCFVLHMFEQWRGGNKVK